MRSALAAGSSSEDSLAIVKVDECRSPAVEGCTFSGNTAASALVLRKPQVSSSRRIP